MGARLLVDDMARWGEESTAAEVRVGTFDTRTKDPTESDFTSAVLKLLKVSLAIDFRRNQSMTFLAAELEAFLCPWGISVCCEANASTVAMDGEL